MDQSHCLIGVLTPLRITKRDSPEVVVWRNPRPGSTDYCRIQCLYRRAEDKEIIKKIMDGIGGLTGEVVVIRGRQYRLKMVGTYCDGKVRNFQNGNKSTVTCGICHMKPTQLRGKSFDELMAVEVKEDHLMAGVSVMHLWIKEIRKYL